MITDEEREKLNEMSARRISAIDGIPFHEALEAVTKSNRPTDGIFVEFVIQFEDYLKNLNVDESEQVISTHIQSLLFADKKLTIDNHKKILRALFYNQEAVHKYEELAQKFKEFGEEYNEGS